MHFRKRIRLHVELVSLGYQLSVSLFPSNDLIFPRKSISYERRGMLSPNPLLHPSWPRHGRLLQILPDLSLSMCCRLPSSTFSSRGLSWIFHGNLAICIIERATFRESRCPRGRNITLGGGGGGSTPLDSFELFEWNLGGRISDGF